MPDFQATLCTGVRDVSGLAFSAGRADIEEDPMHPGYARRWRNRAPGFPSMPLIRQPGDAVTFAGGRYGDGLMTLADAQPQVATVLGQRKLKFNRASQQYLAISMGVQLPRVAQGMSVAFQYAKGTDSSDTQVVYDDQQTAKITRRQGGVGRIRLGTSGGGITSVMGSDLADGRWIAKSNTTLLTWQRDGASSTGSQAGASTCQNAAGTAFVGRGAAGDYLDGYVDSLHVWHRELSPLEMDFVWSKLDEDGANFAAFPRAPVAAKRWTDVTGDPTQAQINRLRTEVAVHQFYKLATVSNGGAPPMRVQIAASEDGFVKPDSQLTGAPFHIDWVEVPSSPAEFPITQVSAGWSGVFDCLVRRAGHYTARVFREGGGAIFIHFDVKVVA